MLADEITADLRAIRNAAIKQSTKGKKAPVTLALTSKGINYGLITANPDGSVDTSNVQGVDPDLRVRPFFAQGGDGHRHGQISFASPSGPNPESDIVSADGFDVALLPGGFGSDVGLFCGGMNSL